MDDLLCSNIRRAIQELNSGPVPVPPDWPERKCFYRYGLLTLQPAFTGNRGNPRCLQSCVFGFYALRATVRGALLGVNYLAAAGHLINVEHYAPAVLSAYTSALHSLHAWLALHGRVFIDPAIWPGKDKAPVNTILCKLTRNNQWHFEPSTRSHKNRWLELRSVVGYRAALLPRYYEIIYDAIYGSQGRRPLQDLLSSVKNGRAPAEPLSAVLA